MVFYLYAKKYKKWLNGSKDIPFEKSSDLIGRELSRIYLKNKNFPGHAVFAES